MFFTIFSFIFQYIIVYTEPGLNPDWMMAERKEQRGKVPVTYLELLDWWYACVLGFGRACSVFCFAVFAGHPEGIILYYTFLSSILKCLAWEVYLLTFWSILFREGKTRINISATAGIIVTFLFGKSVCW